MSNAFSRFAALHDDLLILANAWDAGSARLIAAAGAPAIATTSAGVAWSLGYPDGDALPVDLYLGVVGAIVAAVEVPVSADIEGGYSDDPAVVAAHVARFVEAGVVGINIEDGGGTPDLLAAKIAAIRAAVGEALFINARCDVWLRGLAPGNPMEGPMAEFLARAQLYADAGASGIFAPGLADIAAIPVAVTGCHGLPLNLLARPGVAEAAELHRLGVRRLSAGSGITQAVYGLTQRLTQAFLAGQAAPLWEAPLAYGEINALMTR
ncbi:hypothetical protein IP88_02240 [alpha proteobacterium AAP81b]|nr:hypothetical protein IP88_02240 [alpha proteobacterium AAP81b]